MKIGIASDHAGFELKDKLVKYLEAKSEHEIKDYGCDDNSRVDYPDFIKLAAYGLRDGEVERSIVICGSGIGASIVANKVKGIRCALCHDLYTAEYCRRHNDANVMAIGGRLIGEEIARIMVDLFLSTDFEAGRHSERIKKISDLEL